MTCCQSYLFFSEKKRSIIPVHEVIDTDEAAEVVAEESTATYDSSTVSAEAEDGGLEHT